MTTELIILAATAILAVVAVVAAFVAVRVARRAAQAPTPTATTTSPATEAKPVDDGSYSTDLVFTPMAVVRTPPKQPDAHVLDGRVVVTPTRRQVVDATMGKPLVRLSVLSHGIAHALRPESRDHIRGLMRREFRSRRRQRKRAARHAARIEPSFSRQELSAISPAEGWLGELPQSATRTSEVNDR